LGLPTTATTGLLIFPSKIKSGSISPSDSSKFSKSSSREPQNPTRNNPSILELTGEIMECFPHIQVNVFAIENRFFGEKITVTGLLTGQDIIDQLKEKDLGDILLLPCNVLKADEPVFLDDISLEELRQALQVQVNIIQSEGANLVDQIAACGLKYGGKDE
jgi:NifB/MoaA-like Fe-S oxidoreductase